MSYKVHYNLEDYYDDDGWDSHETIWGPDNACWVAKEIAEKLDSKDFELFSHPDEPQKLLIRFDGKEEIHTCFVSFDYRKSFYASEQVKKLS